VIIVSASSGGNSCLGIASAGVAAMVCMVVLRMCGAGPRVCR
jgi:hypothetical protein